jgi:hypothetical protein
MVKIEKKKLGKSKLRNIVAYICVLYIIFITDSLFFATNISEVRNYAKYVIILSCVIIIIYSLYKNKLKRYNLLEIVALITIIILIFCTAIWNGDFSNKLLSKILIFIFGYFISLNLTLETFANIYVKWMRIIAYVSLIGYFFADFFRVISVFPMIKSTAGLQYINLIFAVIPQRNYVMERCFGPFWEPGVFQAYLIIAIVFIMFINKSSNKQRVIDLITFIGVLLITLSTTAYFAIIPLLCAYLLTTKKIVKIRYKILIIILTAIFFTVFFNDQLYMQLFYKIESQNASYISRVGSITDNFNVWMQNPIFGVGPVELERQLVGYSIVNTIMMHFSIYGVFIGLFFLYKLYRFIRSISNNIFIALLILVSVGVSISGENLVYSSMINTIIFLCPENKFSAKN